MLTAFPAYHPLRRSASVAVVKWAKALALTMLDVLTNPGLVREAQAYFRDVQTKDMKYRSLLRDEDRPAIWLNKRIMEEYRERLRPLYYDSGKYETYLEQLGVKYPVLEKR